MPSLSKMGLKKGALAGAKKGNIDLGEIIAAPNDRVLVPIVVKRQRYDLLNRPLKIYGRWTSNSVRLGPGVGVNEGALRLYMGTTTTKEA
jgi:hypothetical protein